MCEGFGVRQKVREGESSEVGEGKGRYGDERTPNLFGRPNETVNAFLGGY